MAQFQLPPTQLQAVSCPALLPVLPVLWGYLKKRSKNCLRATCKEAASLSRLLVSGLYVDCEDDNIEDACKVVRKFSNMGALRLAMNNETVEYFQLLGEAPKRLRSLAVTHAFGNK